MAPLAEAGRLFGRLAHLLDAVEDKEADAVSGAWNPLAATGTPRAEARRLCDDALHGIRLALRDAEFTDDKLAHVLLAHELRRSVDRAFGATCAHQAPGPFGPPPPGFDPDPPERDERDGYRDSHDGRRPRSFLAGCALAVGLCCTCRACCASEFEGPWSGKKREGWCNNCDCDCGGCDCNCDGCCCDGCDGCDCCCPCDGC